MSLDLDERQRAMLQEMGVRVWQPAPQRPALPALPALASLAAANGRATPPGPVSAALRPLAEAAVRQQPLAAGLASADASEALLASADGQDWPALAEAVSRCQSCELCRGRRAPVFAPPQPPLPADWLVLGEPPDDEEERAGAAFAGPTGQLLGNMLRALGLSRQSGAAQTAAQRAYLTNVVKCRPAVLRVPQPQELRACRPYLSREIALVRPKVILAMGRFAAQSLLQDSLPEAAELPLGKLRGQTYYYLGIPVVVTYHPGSLLRSQADKARAWADLCRAAALVQAAAATAGP